MGKTHDSGVEYRAVAGVLVAIVAAITLTMRRRQGIKTPRPETQVFVRREDRVRIVKMPAEKRPE